MPYVVQRQRGRIAADRISRLRIGLVLRAHYQNESDRIILLN